MKTVIYCDENGYLRATKIRDTDPDELAQQGIPLNSMDLELLDWDSMKKELHNLLIKRGLFSIRDIEKNPGALSNAVNLTITRCLTNLYKNTTQ